VLLVYAWCIMSNHFHMIASTKEGYNLSDILRDFTKHTSKRIMAEIEANPQESRKNWRVWIFQSAGKKNSNNKNHQFWQQDNHPIELSTNAMIDQRLHYIHMNSVKECIIDEPEHLCLFQCQRLFRG
jgi:putative transposase